MGMISTALSCFSLLLVLLSFGKIKKTMISIGARGDIAAALFAALAFGGVVVPVTLAGDFLHVILGPFSGLVTGLLSGVVQYMLLMSLLVLFRRPGVTALFFPDSLASFCCTFWTGHTGRNPSGGLFHCGHRRSSLHHRFL